MGMRKRFFEGLTLSTLLFLTVAFIPGVHAQTSISISAARSAGVGATVTVNGVVTRAKGAFTRIQDSGAGLVIRQTSGGFFEAVRDGVISEGDSVQVTGVLSEFRQLLQINETDVRSFQHLGRAQRPAVPIRVALNTLLSQGEQYESRLIEVINLTTTSTGAFAAARDYPVTDTTSSALVLRTPNASDTELVGEIIPTGRFTFTGIVGQFNTTDPAAGYQLLPVYRTDVSGPVTALPTEVFFPAEAAAAPRAGGTYALRISLRNPSATTATTVTLALTGGTGVNGEDIAAFSSTQLTFPAGSTADQTVTLTLRPRTENRTLIFALQNVAGGTDARLGAPSTFTLTLTGDQFAYVTLFPGVFGPALRDSIRARYTPQTLGYNGARDQMFSFVYNENRSVEGLYSGAIAQIDQNPSTARSQANAQSFDTEHIWPQSLGAQDEPARSNLHILGPTWTRVNSDRGSLPFGNVPVNLATNWYKGTTVTTTAPTSDLGTYSRRGGGRFEPRDAEKGDISRSMFYFAAIYENIADASFFAVQRDELRAWHRIDPVSSQEAIRHQRIVQVQGKANPFVLDSSLVRRAFFQTQDQPDPVVPTIADARREGVGATVTIRGVVSRARGAFVYLQDTTGGMTVRQTAGALFNEITAGTVAAGDSIEVTGRISAFSNQLQISGSDLTAYRVIQRGKGIPTPLVVTLSEVETNGEAYEGRLVRVERIQFATPGVTFTAATNFPLTGSMVVARVPNANDTQFPGQAIPAEARFTGVVGQFSSDPATGYQLLLINSGDLSTVTTSVEAHETLAFRVSEPFPHPARYATNLTVDLPQPGTIQVAMYDLTGRRVHTVPALTLPSGAGHALALDVAALPAGLYLYRVSMDNTSFTSSGRLVVIR